MRRKAASPLHPTGRRGGHPVAASPWVAAVCLTLGALACGGGEAEEAENPQPVPATPLAIRKEMRAVAFDLGDVDTIAGRLEAVRSEVPAIILRSQLHDERSVMQNSEGPRAFKDRILALKEEVDRGFPGGVVFEVHLDLLAANRTVLYAPEDIRAPDRHFRKRSNGTETPFRTRIVGAVEEVAAAIRPRRFIVGTAMNLYHDTQAGAADWGNFLEFYRTLVRPAIKRASPDTLVSVGIHWDSFVAAADAEAEEMLRTGKAQDGTDARARADLARFQELLGPILGDLDELALEAHPPRSDASAIEDDHYTRLLRLVPRDTPVAFIRVWSPFTSAQAEGGDMAARQFLRRFRHLVAGINVTEVAWERVRDVEGGSACEAWQANAGVPGDHRTCYAGLFRSTGIPKALWEEYLRTDVPPED